MLLVSLFVLMFVILQKVILPNVACCLTDSTMNQNQTSYEEVKLSLCYEYATRFPVIKAQRVTRFLDYHDTELIVDAKLFCSQ